jgi:predicted O-linked N-acetylglucosamine transferase (SPINDLY family)
LFAKEGIDASCLHYLPWTESRDEHLKTYNQVDISLDPFPYNGTTTTCEALWMGVPVITMIGDRHSGRVGASILHHAGLDELIFASVEEYINGAIRMTQEIKNLAIIRANMREKLKKSVLLDIELFVMTLEEVYIKLWSKWCETKGKVAGLVES